MRKIFLSILVVFNIFSLYEASVEPENLEQKRNEIDNNSTLKEPKTVELVVTTFLQKITFVSSIDENNVSSLTTLHEFLSNIEEMHSLKIYLGPNFITSILRYIYEEVERIGLVPSGSSLEKFIYILKSSKSIPFFDIIDGNVDVFVYGNDEKVKKILEYYQNLKSKELSAEMKKWIYPALTVSTIQADLSGLLFSLFNGKFVNLQNDLKSNEILEQLHEMISPVKLEESNELYRNIESEPIIKEQFIKEHTENGVLCGSIDISTAVPYVRNGIKAKSKNIFSSSPLDFIQFHWINQSKINIDKDIRVWKIPYDNYEVRALEQYFAGKPVDIIVITDTDIVLILNPAVVLKTSLNQIMKHQYDFLSAERLGIYFFLYKISVFHQIEGVNSPVDHPKIREYMSNRDKCSISNVISFLDTFLETKDDFKRFTQAGDRLTVEYLYNIYYSMKCQLKNKKEKILDLVSSYFRKENIDFDFWAEFLGETRCRTFSDELREENKPIFAKDSEIAKLVLETQKNQNVREWIVLILQLKYGNNFPKYENDKNYLLNLADDFVSTLLRGGKFDKETLITIIEIILTQCIAKANHLDLFIPLLPEEILIRFVHHENNQFQINFLQELDNRTRKSESQAIRIGSLLGKYYLQTGKQIPLCEFHFCYFAYIYLSDLNIKVTPEIENFYFKFDKKSYRPDYLLA